MTTQTHTHSRGWLDTFAISMSFICAIHCMITPVLVAVLPVVASSFWVHKDFHLWMLLLVIPMALISLLMGCKRHKSKLVLALGVIGLLFLCSVAVYESFFHSPLLATEHAHCANCLQREAGNFLTLPTALNLIGAFFLTCAHGRNFYLCRKSKCCH